MTSINQRMRRAAAGQNLRHRRNNMPGIAAGDTPTKPTSTPVTWQPWGGQGTAGTYGRPNHTPTGTTPGIVPGAPMTGTGTGQPASGLPTGNINLLSPEDQALRRAAAAAKFNSQYGFTHGPNAPAGSPYGSALFGEARGPGMEGWSLASEIAWHRDHPGEEMPNVAPDGYNSSGSRYFTPAPTQAPAAPATAESARQPEPPKPQPHVVATPQSAFENGKSPEKHAAYWASVGWNMNPATGVWHGPNGATWDMTPAEQQGGTNNPKPTDPNGPQSPVPAPGGQTGQTPGQGSNQLPLDPQFEAQRALLDSNLERQLSALDASGLRLDAEQKLALARLATNQGVDVQNLLENMAGRGTLNSSLYGDARSLLATDYGRQNQDLGISIADALASLNVQRGDVKSNYDQDLVALLRESAGRAAADTNAPVDQSPRRPARRRGRNR